MDSYLEFVLERLSIAGNVSSKAMFGGYGIYTGDFMFGLVADGVLYLKVSESNIKDYIQAGMKPFSYEAKNGKPISMSYWQLPVDILESNEDLSKWVDKSIEAAKAVKSRKKIVKKIKGFVSTKTSLGNKKVAVTKKKATVSKKKGTVAKKKSTPIKKKSSKPVPKKKPISKKKKK